MENCTDSGQKYKESEKFCSECEEAVEIFCCGQQDFAGAENVFRQLPTEKNTVQNEDGNTESKIVCDESVEQLSDEDRKGDGEAKTSVKSTFDGEDFNKCEIKKQELVKAESDRKGQVLPVDFLNLIDGNIGEIKERLSSLEKLFINRIEFTDFEENSRKNMDAELQKYKNDFFSDIVKPVLMEIITVREEMLKSVQRYKKSHPDDSHPMLRELQSYAEDDLCTVLENNGIEIYKSEVNGDFVSGRHRLKKPLVPTENRDLHGKIAESASSGYMYKGNVIYGEWVKRYVYQEFKTEENV